jgi:hypothetical protein
MSESKAVVVEVEMLAFMNGEVREVEVPAEEFLAAPDELAVLELVFKYGQNDFQPKPFASVSVGDVIRFRGRRIKVAGMGFEEAA